VTAVKQAPDPTSTDRCQCSKRLDGIDGSVAYFLMDVGRYQQAQLGGQGIELFGGGEASPVDGDHLPFLDHVHQFDTLQSHSGGTEGVES